MAARDRSLEAPPPGVRQTGPGWRGLLRTRRVLAVLLIELIMAPAVAVGLWAQRQQTLRDEWRLLDALSIAMAVQAESTLTVASTALRATRLELREGLLVPGSDHAHNILRTRVSLVPMFHALLVLDAQGREIATSRHRPVPGAVSDVSLADSDFFVAARRTPRAELQIGAPRASGLDDREAVPLSMSWRSHEGEFRGVVVLVAAPDFLDGEFTRLAVAPDIRLSIRPARDSPGANQADLLTDPLDRHLLAATHRLQRFALQVVVTRPARAVLDDWALQAGLVGVFVVVALGVALRLVMRHERERIWRQQAQVTRAAEQERAVRAFQAAQEGHWEWAPATREGHLSPRMKELLGLDRDDAAWSDGAGWLERAAIHPEDIESVRMAMHPRQPGQEAPVACTFRVRQVDGSWRHVRLRGRLWRDDPVHLSGTASDVTAEVEAQAQARRLEDQLQQARKLEALGTLAGGIAHDVNNILAAVIGYGELARDAAVEGSAQARQIDQVLRAGQRGKALVDRILSFSRTGLRPRSAFLLGPVIDEVLQMLAASLPAEVVLDRRLCAQEVAVRGDATMVFEAVMNLCTNALQAMPEGGVLGVELSVVIGSGPLVLHDRSLPAGTYARLRVTDTGTGIDPAVMARLFEPFFTTKGPHRGTGLGLAVVHGVMVDLGGAIEAKSRPGEGACFDLYFPRVDSAGVDRSRRAVDSRDPRGQGETVLVVDDDATLVALAEELLAELGYEPVGLSSGVQALAEVRADPDRFDLVITDEVMPGMAGTELATALQALRPGLPIVLVSGYGGPQLEARAAAAGVAVLVKKPLLRAELARAVRQALHARPSPQEAASA